MGQDLEMGIYGLWLNPNPFSDVPAGALKKADNIVIDRPGQADSRRGFFQFNDIIADSDMLYSFDERLFLHADDTIYIDDEAGTWDALTGSYEPVSADVRLRSEEMNKNLYLATSDGVQVLNDATATALYLAGSPPALDGTAELDGGMTGWFPTDSQVAYRIVWGRVDANKNLILGAPSARILVVNSSGSDETVDLEFTIPFDITVDDFYQVYRSFPSASDDVTPDDELQLVFQANPTAGEITAGVISMTDVATIEQMGASLYTNPSQQGIEASNYRPPLAVDIVEFQQFMFFANTSREPKVFLTLQANYSVGETFIVGAETFTAAAAENIAAQEFEVGSTIAETLASLIRVINRAPGNPSYYAYPIDDFSFYVSGRLLTTASYTISGTGQHYDKTLPQDSDANAQINQIGISKNREPESVPLGYNLRAGSGKKAIKRILKTREAVIILKEDGTFRLTGTGINNFSIDEIDNTLIINGANTAVSFANSVTAVTNRGVAEIDINGYRIISDPIAQAIFEVSAFSNFAELAVGVGYDSDEKYLLSAPSNDEDEEVTQVFVYNWFTKSWTRWENPFVAGMVNRVDGKLYLVYADGQTVKERKSFSYLDYADYEFDVTISSVSDDIVTVASVPAGVEEGQTLTQGGLEAVILDITGNDLTVEFDNLPWVPGAAIIYQPITNRVAWLENAAGNPGVLKHLQEMTYAFRDAAFRNILLTVATNFSNGGRSLTIESVSAGGWGSFEWGELPWGGIPGGFQPIRTYFPQETTRASWFTLELELSQAFYSMSLLGVSVIASVMSPRFK